MTHKCNPIQSELRKHKQTPGKRGKEEGQIRVQEAGQELQTRRGVEREEQRQTAEVESRGRMRTKTHR